MTSAINYTLDGQCPYCGSYSRSCEYQENGSDVIATCTCKDCGNKYEETYRYYRTDYCEEEEE